MNATDLLAGMAAKTPSKGKDDKPRISDPTLSPVIEEWIKAKREKTDAEAKEKTAYDQIRKFAAPERLRICSQLGKVCSSIIVNDRLTFTQKMQYSPVVQERATDLSKAFGKDYDVFFKSTLEVKLKKNSAADNAVIEEFVRRLGKDFIEQHCEVKFPLLVQEAFHVAYTTRPEVQAIAQPFLDDDTIHAYSAGLSVK